MIKKLFKRLLPSVVLDIFALRSVVSGTKVGRHVKLYRPYRIFNSVIGDYSYVSRNSQVSHTSIGKFCSIGPGFFSGWGVHPVDKLSTSPMFYSTRKQNGVTIASVDKIIEQKRIIIGNDVFIGANVTILDGVKIGDGAVIAAGAVVARDVEAYSIVGGVPAKVVRKRLPDEIAKRLEKIQWWNFPEERLQLIERYFENVEGFIELTVKGVHE